MFLTNNFALPAETIAALYKKRWQVELFSNGLSTICASNIFFGTSENALKTQIWIAVCVYVLAAIIKKELGLEISLYTFLQILSVRPFEKTPVLQAFLESAHKSDASLDDNPLLPLEF